MAKIQIYTRQLCGFCTSAKRLLDEKKLAYEEFDATYAPEKRNEMIQRAKGRSTFPQIFVGETHVGGCDDLYDLNRAGKLDELAAA